MNSKSIISVICRIAWILLFPLALLSCRPDNMSVYDTAFVYISTVGGSDAAVIDSEIDNVHTYYIHLSSGKQTEALKVDLSVEAGSGLTEGVDYEKVSTESSVTFLPGIYRMPFRIRWKPRKVDNSADNNLVIKLTGNSKNYVLGFPGPDKTFSKLTLTKANL